METFEQFLALLAQATEKHKLRWTYEPVSSASARRCIRAWYKGTECCPGSAILNPEPAIVMPLSKLSEQLGIDKNLARRIVQAADDLIYDGQNAADREALLKTLGLKP